MSLFRGRGAPRTPTKMNLKTEYKNEVISDGNNNYGAGGAFPDLAPIIESEAKASLMSQLFPELELEEALDAHTVQSHCPLAREIEAQNELPANEEYQQIESGEYPVTVTVDGAEHLVTVTLAW